MEKYLNMPIKSVITEFPRIGTILNEYDIGCVTCGVGTCLLKDIIDIHDVPKHIEAEMMKKIEAVINGEAAAESTEESAPIVAPKVITYSEPIYKLVVEHKLIKRLLALIPELCSRVEKDLEGNRELIKKSVDFIRQFADKFHHAKEEDILFAYAKGNTDILNVMYEDHKKGRYYVKAVLLGLETGDASYVSFSLKHYRELLTEHIKKEDEILYPWIEKGMTAEQIKELEEKFNKTDESFGLDFYDKWEDFIISIERGA
jgi:hemerythrin-like domain-containing protein